MGKSEGLLWESRKAGIWDRNPGLSVYFQYPSTLALVIGDLSKHNYLRVSADNSVVYHHQSWRKPLGLTGVRQHNNEKSFDSLGQDGCSNQDSQDSNCAFIAELRESFTVLLEEAKHNDELPWD